MELVNKEFAKLDKVDLLCIASEKSSKSVAINNLLNFLVQYEKTSDDYVGEFYISTSGSYYGELNAISKATISRKSLLNSFLYAGYNLDWGVMLKLQPFISKKQVFSEELGALSDYVMDHSMDFNEFCDGQQEKLIFDEIDNSFKKGLIYKSDEKKHIK